MDRYHSTVWIVSNNLSRGTWRGSGMLPWSHLKKTALLQDPVSQANTRHGMTNCLRHRLGRLRGAAFLVSWTLWSVLNRLANCCHNLLWFQDLLNQRVCIIAYLRGWYSTSGMFCQTFLFHPTHCDKGVTSNGTVSQCVVTVPSSCASHILVQTKVRQRVFQWRGMLPTICACVVILSVSSRCSALDCCTLRAY